MCLKYDTWLNFDKMINFNLKPSKANACISVVYIDVLKKMKKCWLIDTFFVWENVYKYKK